MLKLKLYTFRIADGDWYDIPVTTKQEAEKSCQQLFDLQDGDDATGYVMAVYPDHNGEWDETDEVYSIPLAGPLDDGFPSYADQVRETYYANCL